MRRKPLKIRKPKKIEDVTTTLHRIAHLEGDLSGMTIPNACREAIMEISLLRDRVVLLERQVELTAAVNLQMREELEARRG